MNPEFQRNLWLEAAPRRIAWAAVTLALIYGAAAALMRDNPYGVITALGGVGTVIFVVCAIFWGARATGNSVLAEIADRTWDFQRLSALDPWRMTWGKLFGATSLAWLCALTGLAFMFAAAVQRGEPGAGSTIVFMLALALLAQGVSLAGALIGVRKARAEGRTARAGQVLGGLIIGAVLLSWVAGSSGFQRGAGLEGFAALWSARGFTEWAGSFWPAAQFRAVAVALFAAWSVIGAWRLMRLELQMQNAPVVWPAFLVFLAVFAGGFALRGGWSEALTVAALAVALAAYAAAFAEPADKVRMRQFMHHLAQRDWARAAPLTPAPLAPVIFAALLVLAGFLARGGAPAGLDLGQAAALIAFVIRDLGVIAFFRMGARPQKGDFSAVVALGVLYGVGGAIGFATAGVTGTALMVPLSQAPMVSLASGAVQAVLIWILAAGRIRQGAVSGLPSAPASAPA